MSKKSISSNGGGILGSGVSGLIGTGVVCYSTDNSYYCNFIKIINVSLIILGILFFIYVFFSAIKKRRIK